MHGFKDNREQHDDDTAGRLQGRGIWFTNRRSEDSNGPLHEQSDEHVERKHPATKRDVVLVAAVRGAAQLRSVVGHARGPTPRVATNEQLADAAKLFEKSVGPTAATIFRGLVAERESVNRTIVYLAKSRAVLSLILREGRTLEPRSEANLFQTVTNIRTRKCFPFLIPGKLVNLVLRSFPDASRPIKSSILFF